MRKLLPLLLVPIACGPSFQTIYENDARFEHCYALDDSATATLDLKARCWKDWKEHHTFGQTRDRVEYAQSRYVALNSVPDLPTDEAMMHAAPGEVGEHQQLTAPTPTNAFAPPEAMAATDAGTHVAPPPTITAFVAPPPPTLTSADAGATTPPPNTVRPRAAVCTDDCTRSFQECKSRDAGACDDGYDRCVVNCVKR